MIDRAAKKKIVIVLNGISLEKKRFYKKILPELSGVADVDVKETLTKHDAITLASRATDQHVDAVIACGGDGTLNQVLNGVLTGREKDLKLPAIGLIPLGSGNDFARTVNLKFDAPQIITLVKNFQPQPLDIGQINYRDFDGNEGTKYFVNVADIGMGPVVVQKVNSSDRVFGHAVAYYKSILSTFASYKPMEVIVKTPEWSWRGKLRTLAVGNGKCYGHGLYVTPDAIPDDRQFNVFICGDVSVFDFVRHTGTLKKGKHVIMREIFYKDANVLELDSPSECLIEGDGEIFGTLPAKISLIERQMNFLV